jgi:endoglucanase
MEYLERQFLANLLGAASPSGFEDKAAELWCERARGFAKNVRRDRHGNSFATLAGLAPGLVMLAGHIDEIGLMVTHIDENGFVYFQTIGGWDAQVLPGQRLQLYKKNGARLCHGVIGRLPIHLLEDEERKKAAKIDQLWIDTPFGKRAKEEIEAGDFAVIDVQPLFLHSGHPQLPPELLVSRGLDDKVGAFVVLEAIRLMAGGNVFDQPTVTAVATAQEEVGIRGARTSAYTLNPQIAIAVDVTFATDHPGSNKNKYGDVKLGGGPVIACGPNFDRQVFEALERTAKRHGIPYQIGAAARITGTDAGRIQVNRGGVSMGLVSIPNRYMHTPNELVNLADVDNAAKLIAHFCAEEAAKLV